ncbi:TPR repeat region-containing protein [Nocardia macrotermitis]|uniref:TPR repeat domain-containing protein n=1 Tax=Nocardia macrotermitis TaxID=2585198 RepID=A0A7K0CXG4_9NOCA|nr:hypothetical protein [Nocardia macrotermitis]MQY18195.1 hypothetical protein [Nocardia macrotermitis]
MTGPASPLEWVRKANPATLNSWADEWDQLGSALEGVFQHYVDAVTKVDGAYWDGKTARAAHDRATGDLRAVQQLVDKLGAVAKLARQGVGTIDAPLRRARGLLAECDHNGWTVSEISLTVGRSGNISNDELVRMGKMNSDLQSAIHDALVADIGVRDALNNARNGLAIAFASPAALGTDQAKKDAAQLLKDPQHMSEDEIQRLIDAGHLTPEQTAALHSGNAVTIPAAQMEYINQISRSLDGKSPQEIQQIMDKLPPDAQKGLANSLQLISTDNITSGIKNNPAVPEKGGSNLMPKKILQSLDRKDLVTSANPGTSNTISLNGVADNQAIAKIAGTADPSVRYNTELDKKILNDGAKYLSAQTAWEQNPSKNAITFQVDGKGAGDHQAITERFFSSVGDDKPAVQQLVAPDGKPNEQFYHDALTHKWSDQGKSVSTLFNFADHSNPHNPVDADAARHQSAIMNSFARFAASDNTPNHFAGGDDKWKLYDIPDTNHSTVGQLNPELMRSLSTGLSPYINDLTNTTNQSKDGFDVTIPPDKSWTDPSGKNYFSGSKNIFSLMNTDSVAGQNFNAHALAASLQQQVEYGHDPNAHNARAHLYNSGILQGLVDSGLRDEISAQTKDTNQIAQDAYSQKKQAFELVKSLVTTSVPIGSGDDKITAQLPYSDGVSKILGLGGDPLKDAIIGPAPTASSDDIGLNPPNFDQQAYAVLANTQIPDNLRSNYSELFDANGNLKSWSEIRSMPYDPSNPSETNPASAVTTLFNQLGYNDNHANSMRDGYSDVTMSHRR